MVRSKAENPRSIESAEERRRIGDDVWTVGVPGEYLALKLHNDALN